MTGQGQGAGRLAVVTGHRHVPGQRQVGTGVDDRMAGDVDVVTQAEIAGREHQVAAGVADGAADEAAHRAAAAAGDGQVTRRQVGDVADDGAGIGQRAQRAGGGDV
ncbi:hypothetical protein AZA_85355 [Nitrospirillum viridazoti Y2]|nr:hypothetical protein AZA_85355 [Nitrospirillum amazonense Y2]